MDNERYDAMKHAVDLARTGKFNNWRTLAHPCRFATPPKLLSAKRGLGSHG
jgi:hypothetical protein